MNRIYSASYYGDCFKNGNGASYSEEEKLYPFFESVAGRLVGDYRPRTVLDVGCAFGYLVKALRAKGVDAYGIDISEYAISHADEGIRDYVRVSSAGSPLPDGFPGHYDMVVSIEVLEHMGIEEGEMALARLCQVTDTFVFSSTDSDLRDITHINVQRKEYWARVFARQGFFRDVQQTPTYISACADTYRRRGDFHNVIQEYEVALRVGAITQGERHVASLLFYDTGEGFCDANRIVFEDGSVGGRVRVEARLPEGVVGIRYDPAHQPCILSGVEVLLDGQRAEALSANGSFQYGSWIFSGDAPQIFIPAGGCRKVEITGKLDLVEDMGIPPQLFAMLAEGKRSQELLAGLRQLAGEGHAAIEGWQQDSREIVSLLCENRDRQIDEVAQYKEKIQLLMAESERYRNKVQALSEELGQSRKENHQLQEKKVALQGRIHEAVKKLARSNTLIRNFQDEAKELEREIEEQKKKAKEQEREIEGQKREIQRITGELEKNKIFAQGKIDELEKEKGQLKAARQELAAAQAVCQDYQDAFFWKVTKPMRMAVLFCRGLAGKICRAKPARYGLKVIGSLKKDGAGATIGKIKKHFSRKRQLETVGKMFSLDEGTRQEQEGTAFPEGIKFSILVPLYNTPLKFLQEMAGSVLLQTYQNWELCLADGSDKDKGKEIEAYCGRLQRKDRRVKYRRLKENMGISENTNACIDMAEGEYIGLFDHDDLLHPSALYEMMCAIQREGADFLYTDEAVFEGNVRNIITAHFKPDYAVDTLRANNYICHFTVFRRSLLEKAGRFRREYDGSQDHDLVLRLTASAEKICHIPKVLYYWRSHPASVASDIQSKPYASDAGRRAVAASLEAHGEHVLVESSEAFPAIYRVSYELKGSPFISLIVPCRNYGGDTAQCVKSILECSSYGNFEVLLVGSGEEDPLAGSHGFFDKEGRVKTHCLPGEFSYAALSNHIASWAKGEYLVFLHSDVQVIAPKWLEELLMYAQREDVGAVGAKLYYRNDTIRHAGMVLGMGKDRTVGYAHLHQPKGNGGYMGRLCYAQDMSAVSASCMMVRKEVFQEMGGFSAEFPSLYDADFCMRLRKAGYLVVFNPYAELYHFKAENGKDGGEAGEGSIAGKGKREGSHEENLRFQERWKSELERGDPYFNPNFDLMREDFFVKG